MADIEFTAEETQALQAMQADTAPVTEEEMAANPPEVKAEPAPAPQEKPAEAQAQPPEGYVPHGALHAEREKRKALEAEIEKLRKAQEAANVKPLEVPDPILEPERFKQFQIEQIKAQQEAIQRMEQQRIQEQTYAQRMQTAAQLETQFAQATPDYGDAVKFLVESRERELSLMGHNPDMVRQVLAQEANAIFDQGMAIGKNPAQIMYEFAKMRGWSGQQATPSPATQPQAQQIEALARAQRNTGSLATAGGPANTGEITVEQLSRMSESELRAMPKAKRDELMRKAMGG